MSAKGYGKLLLLGEYSVLFGSPALGVRLPQYLEVSLKKSTDNVTHEQGKLSSFREWVSREYPDYPDMRHLRIQVKGDLPAGRGFGSSAALTTALSRLLFPEEEDLLILAEKARRMENFFHGRSSGIDTLLSLHKGISLYRSGPREGKTFKPVQIEEGYLLAGSLPRSTAGKESIERILSLKEGPGSAEKDCLEELILSNKKVLSLTGANLPLEDFIQGVKAAHSLLTKLGLVHPRQKEILEWGRYSGALAGKISGAGLGGAYFLVFVSKDQAAQCRNVLKGKGVEDLMLIPLNPKKDNRGDHTT